MLEEIKRNTVYGGAHLQIQNIHLEGGKVYEACSRVANKSSVSGLLRHIENNSYILIEQYRYPVKNKVLELVAGLTDKEGLSETEILLEEIKEEAGYHENNVQNIQYLAKLASSAGMSTETSTLFDVEVTGTRGKQELGVLEDIDIIEVPYGDFDDLIREKTKEGVLISSDVCMAVYLTLQKTGKYL